MKCYIFIVPRKSTDLMMSSIETRKLVPLPLIGDNNDAIRIEYHPKGSHDDLIMFTNHKKLIPIVERFMENGTLSGHNSWQAWVPGKEAPNLLKALKAYQDSNSKSFVPTTLFNKSITHLIASNRLLAEQAEIHLIRTKFTWEEYQNDVVLRRNLDEAISLTLHHSQRNDNYSAHYWLAKTEQFLPDGTTLNSLINLEEFFQKWTHITVLDIFVNCPQAFQAAINSKNIQYLRLHPYISYTEELTHSIGQFLKMTSSIRHVKFEATWIDGNNIELSEQNILPIIEALKVNTSIEHFDISGSKLSENDVERILDAIDSNPNTKIEYMAFHNYLLSTNCKSSIEAFLKCHPTIKIQYVKPNQES